MPQPFLPRPPRRRSPCQGNITQPASHALLMRSGQVTAMYLTWCFLETLTVRRTATAGGATACCPTYSSVPGINWLWGPLRATWAWNPSIRPALHGQPEDRIFPEGRAGCRFCDAPPQLILQVPASIRHHVLVGLAVGFGALLLCSLTASFRPPGQQVFLSLQGIACNHPASCSGSREAGQQRCKSAKSTSFSEKPKPSCSAQGP